MLRSNCLVPDNPTTTRTDSAIKLPCACWSNRIMQGMRDQTALSTMRPPQQHARAPRSNRPIPAEPTTSHKGCRSRTADQTTSRKAEARIPRSNCLAAIDPTKSRKGATIKLPNTRQSNNITQGCRHQGAHSPLSPTKSRKGAAIKLHCRRRFNKISPRCTIKLPCSR